LLASVEHFQFSFSQQPLFEKLTMMPETQESMILGRRLAKITGRVSSHFDSYSKIVDPRREIAIPRVQRSEIRVSKLLGRGGFNDVYELHSIQLTNSGHKDSFTDAQRERRNELARKVSSGALAVKYLSRSTMMDPDRLMNGASDLVIESKLLANLSHPNIISLHGISSDGTDGFLHCVEGNYFIITDKLESTLIDMIDKWHLRNARLEKEYPSLNRNRLVQNPVFRDLFLTRLKVASDLAKAVSYLHSKNIIFRDLKGDNIGFDKSGTLKLFDFGLAKELNPREGLDDGTYKMSGMTGTQRYMAPEVMNRQPYNLSADTYSYSVVIWEVFSLQKSFPGMSPAHHAHHVMNCNGRPSVDPAWPPVLSTLITCGWHADLTKRPEMSVVSRGIEKCIDAVYHASRPLRLSQVTLGRLTNKARAA
jgi:serine/threonine protein kinase